jgi:hypothetical protein
VGLERYGKDVAKLAVEVRQIALRVSDGADHQLTLNPEREIAVPTGIKPGAEKQRLAA